MQYYMGIDAGGSNIRVALAQPDLTPIVEHVAASMVNPSIIGNEAAAQVIRTAIQTTLTKASVTPRAIAGIGMGLAGITAADKPWLRELIRAIAPDAYIAIAVDYEVALIGAHGKRRGAILVAGTGSVAYGVNDAGERFYAGGWGYLIDDAGSGYWIGNQALRAITRIADGRDAQKTVLTGLILEALKLESEEDLKPWLYRAKTPRNHAIGQLAPLVIKAASQGDIVSREIIQRASAELALLAQTVIDGLCLSTTDMAFIGGLLEKPNLLNQKLCETLKLPALPKPRHSPVIGAIFMARDQLT